MGQCDAIEKGYSTRPEVTKNPAPPVGIVRDDKLGPVELRRVEGLAVGWVSVLLLKALLK